MARYFAIQFAVAVALLAGLASAGVAVVNTREGCPPEGYTAIANYMDLSRLPANGKYAICLTPQEESEDPQVRDFKFKGVFKLRDSELRVDQGVRIVAEWPSRLDWRSVIATRFFQRNDWGGVHVEGSPSDLTRPGHLKGSSPYGDCGSLVSVTMDQLNDDDDSLLFRNCSGRKSVAKNVRVIADDPPVGLEGVVVVLDSDGLVFEDLSVTLLEGGAPDEGHPILVSNSNAAFVRPLALTEADSAAIKIRSGSNVTICDPVTYSGDRTQFQVGAEDDEDRSSVSIAGNYNAKFPENVDFVGVGGIVVTLKKCPATFRKSYDPSWWTQYYTVSPDP